MSSTTWTTREVASNAAAAAPRAVARGRGAARGVDDGARRLARGAARAGAAARRHASLPIPAAAAHLHWLLFTPFRYPPPPGGSRFRGPNDPGVFYGADEIRTACAELGYWRWRHLQDSPALAAMPTQAANGVPGEDRDRCGRPSRERRSRAIGARWTDPRRLWRMPGASAGRRARRGVGAIRYESVRDPQHARAARCCRPPRSRRRFRSSSRRGCCRSRASASIWQRTRRAASRRARVPPRPRNGRRRSARSAAPTTSRRGARCRRSPTRATPDTPDEIWLTEHPPVYTLGLAGRREHLLRDNGIPTIKVDRGGQVTYHGPGQLVVYLLFDLRRARLGVRAMVRRLEAAVVEWLDSLGISAYGKPAAPGVYVMRVAAPRRRSPRSGSRCATAAPITGSR